MATQKKISELTTGTPVAADLVPFDNAAGTTTKKATVLALRGNLTPTVLETGFSLAGGTTPKTLTVDTDVTASALATQTYADAKIPKTDIDTDGAMAANSDTKIPSQQAVKEYAVPLSYIDTDEALTANSDTKIPSQQAVKALVTNTAFAGIGAASEAEPGAAKLSTAAQANAGTDDATIMTPKKVKDSTAVPAGVVSALAGKVATSGDETINGVKTFASIPVLPSSNPATENQAVRFAALNYTAGDTLVISADAERYKIADASYTKVKEITLVKGGTLRIKFDGHFAGAFDGKIRIYRNGTAVGAERTMTADWFTYTEDVSGWSAGDKLQLYYRTEAGGDDQIAVKNLRLYTGDFLLPTVNTD